MKMDERILIYCYKIIRKGIYWRASAKFIAVYTVIAVKQLIDEHLEILHC